MHEHERSHRPRYSKALIALPLLLAAAGAGSCYWDDDYPGTYDYSYEYYYPYTYYYPTDLAYSSVYYTDYWYYSDWYWLEEQKQDTMFSSVGNVIRALARGEAICPGQVTVTPKMSAAACTSADPNMNNVRSGATLVFTGCMLANGGRLDGTLDVQTMRTASEATCSETTRITLSHTSTITNLTYVAPGGMRLVIPNQTDTGTNSYDYGKLPTTFSIDSTGRVQVYATNGTLSADFNHNGTRTVTYTSTNRSYAITGRANVEDTRTGSRATLTGDMITRVSDCCVPIGGTLQVSRTGGSSPGEHTWSFGPSCGQLTLDGAQVSQPSCL